MDKCLIISAHTAKDCRLAVEHFMQYHAGVLTQFEWAVMIMTTMPTLSLKPKAMSRQSLLYPRF